MTKKSKVKAAGDSKAFDLENCCKLVSSKMTFYGEAMTDDFRHETANNDDAISKLEDTVRQLKVRQEEMDEILSNPTEQMMLAGALAHNARLRPMRAVT